MKHTKETYYFQHDYNARNDIKMMSILSKYGAEAYGVYWYMVELLHEEPQHKIPLERYVLEALSHQIKVPIGTLDLIMKEFFKVGLFMQDNDCFWSNRVLTNIKQRTIKSDKMSKLALKRWNKDTDKQTDNANAMRTQCKSNAIKVKESKVKEIKEKEKTIYKKDIPNFEEFYKYAISKKPNIDIEHLKMKYESWVVNDWKNGLNKPIKNWKTSLLNTLPHIQEDLLKGESQLSKRIKEIDNGQTEVERITKIGDRQRHTSFLLD